MNAEQLEKIKSLLTIDPNTGCWNWHGASMRGFMFALFGLLLSFESANAQTREHGIYRTKEGWFLTKDKETLQMAIRMVTQKDSLAIFGLISRGDLQMSNAGEPVAQVKVHPFAGVEVRPVGGHQVWWTLKEALEETSETAQEINNKVLMETITAGVRERYEKNMFAAIRARNKKLSSDQIEERVEELIEFSQEMDKQGHGEAMNYWRSMVDLLKKGSSLKDIKTMSPIAVALVDNEGIRDDEVVDLLLDAIAGKKAAMDRLELGGERSEKIQSLDQSSSDRSDPKHFKDSVQSCGDCLTSRPSESFFELRRARSRFLSHSLENRWELS
jgi:hypothetical protein